MEELTKTEERIMQIIWDLGRCFVKDIIEKMDEEPKPPYNTISSVVRILEKKEYVGFKAYGKTYEYFPIISKDEYGKFSFKKVFANYFNNSAENLLSFIVKEEKITNAEIEKLKQFIDKQ
ncbi:BlaI/MecI/CopY family transcriptional regulator [Emticicia fontis]